MFFYIECKKITGELFITKSRYCYCCSQSGLKNNLNDKILIVMLCIYFVGTGVIFLYMLISLWFFNQRYRLFCVTFLSIIQCNKNNSNINREIWSIYSYNLKFKAHKLMFEMSLYLTFNWLSILGFFSNCTLIINHIKPCLLTSAHVYKRKIKQREIGPPSMQRKGTIYRMIFN